MVSAVKNMDHVTLHDLYELYPNFDIQIPREQDLLLAHDIIILQHPMYWYSGPALLKQWLDLVLEHGWAYGMKGTALRGKWLMSAISTGGPEAAYTLEGHHQHTLKQFMLPYEQTAKLCNMHYLPPAAITGAHKLDDTAIQQKALQYRALLERLRDEPLDLQQAAQLPNLMELIQLPQA